MKGFPEFYEPKIISTFVVFRHLLRTLSQINPIYALPYHLLKIHFQYYLPTYAYIFKVFSFLQVYLPNPIHISILPIRATRPSRLHFLIWSHEWNLVKSTNHQGTHAVPSSLMLPVPHLGPNVSLAPYFQTAFILCSWSYNGDKFSHPT
jgi:hypothetical protein